MRCQRDQWYLIRAWPRDAAASGRLSLIVGFFAADEVLVQRAVDLQPLPSAPAATSQSYGDWVYAPSGASHVVLAGSAADTGAIERIEIHPVAERDAKSHPLANTPRWTTYQPPFPLEHVVLPEELDTLASAAPHAEVSLSAQPTSKAALAKLTRRAACVLSPSWIQALDLTFSDLTQMAGESWIVIDLATAARLLTASGLTVRLRKHAAPHEIASARVEYADVATRGFALQDVFPWGWVDDEGGFASRGLRATAMWKRYADEMGAAPQLAHETSNPAVTGDVLLASQAVGQGELLLTDAPWIAAGAFGAPLAPALARHVSSMLMGAPLDDAVCYWNRWYEDDVLLRDIADLPRRYSELALLRWAAEDDATVRLGLTLAQGQPQREIMFCTGRIDQTEPHDGVPAEAMIIFMRSLARELREQTRSALRDTRITWQFDSAAGLHHAPNFPSAGPALANVKESRRFVVRVSDEPGGASDEIRVPRWTGVLGDESHAFQAALTSRLMRRIAR